MPFALNILNAFLTYPQVGDAELTGIYDWLTATFECDYVCVSEERHEDGGKHFHAFLRFARRFRSSNQSVFDYNGNHPNIKSAYAPSKCLEYVKKDGNFLEYGDATQITKSGAKRSWESVVGCPTKEEFMSMIQEQFPRDYVLNLERIEYFADKKYKPEAPVYTPTFTNFTIPNQLQEWVAQMDNEGNPDPNFYHSGSFFISGLPLRAADVRPSG